MKATVYDSHDNPCLPGTRKDFLFTNEPWYVVVQRRALKQRVAGSKGKWFISSHNQEMRVRIAFDREHDQIHLYCVREIGTRRLFLKRVVIHEKDSE